MARPATPVRRGAATPLGQRLRRLRHDESMASVAMLACLLVVLCLAGGASRAGEFGQVIVRAAAIGLMMLICATRKTWRGDGVTMPLTVLGVIAAIAAVQLVPLPPALWTLLPGRELFEAAIPAGSQPWRPINLTPDAGLNALLALLVPIAAATILAGCAREDNSLVVDLLLAMIAFSALLGSLQLSGGGPGNPLINGDAGEAAGIFANRNHQALLLACGFPLLGVWGLRAGVRRLSAGRLLVAGGIAVWFLFLILATGSRAGFLLTIGGLASAAALVWLRLRHLRLAIPRWLVPAVLLGAVAVIGVIVALAVSSDRALSLQRLLDVGADPDLRASSMPLMWELILRYAPVGSGLGSFDPVFRIIEPDGLLSPTYLNHAHNDAVELLIETGVAGLVPIGLVLFFWIRLGLLGWRDARAGGTTALAAWSILSLVLLASLVDYPLRTPVVMTVAVAAAWLAWPRTRTRGG